MPDVEEGLNKGVEDVSEVVRKALETRYKPQGVREWLAKYSDNAELALEKVIEMLNDRVQRQVTAEAKLEAVNAQHQAQLKEVELARKELTDKVGEYEAKEAARTAAEKDAAVTKGLTEKFPATATALKLALRDSGYELDHDGKDIVLLKGKTKARFEEVLTPEFYAAYPFARPNDESGFGGSDPRGKVTGEDIAKKFSTNKGANADRYDWSKAA